MVTMICWELEPRVSSSSRRGGLGDSGESEPGAPWSPVQSQFPFLGSCPNAQGLGTDLAGDFWAGGVPLWGWTKNLTDPEAPEPPQPPHPRNSLVP